MERGKKCSFCGRSDKEVSLLISGVNGYICDECAGEAFRVVQEHKKSTTSFDRKDLPKPHEIKAYLDQYVIVKTMQRLHCR